MKDVVRRMTVCKLMGHAWAKTPYPREPNGDGTGEFMRCRRCHKENHTYGTVARGAPPFYG
jgi:hypothetical protein